MEVFDLYVSLPTIFYEWPCIYVLGGDDDATLDDIDDVDGDAEAQQEFVMEVVGTLYKAPALADFIHTKHII